MSKIRSLCTLLRKRATQLVRKLEELARAARATVERHIDRMLEEPDYARAVRDLVEIVVSRSRPPYLARFVADQVVAAYLAILRLIRPPADRCLEGQIWP